MQRDRKLQSIEKSLSTLLGRTPDIHGLLPDAEGWFPVKSLMQALSETPDLRSIRESDLVDICRESDALLEMEEKKIRAKHRTFPALPTFTETLPKLLHISIREKAWPHVFERGLFAGKDAFLILSSDPALALRMGKRKGSKPVSLTIQVAKARESGVSFFSHGEILFCAKEIPASAIMGPPLPKLQKKSRNSEAVREKAEKFMPGSFLLRSEEEKQEGKKGKRSKESWKHNKKRLRREKKHWED